MELTWLADTPQSRNRTRALRACPACQRRKKRCRHLQPQTRWADEDARLGQSCHRTTPRIHTRELTPRSSSYHPQPQPEDPPVRSLASTERFVGDLNPEALIRERLDGPSDNPFKDRVGVWLSSASRDHSPPVQGHYEARPAHNTQTITTLLQHRYTSALTACGRLPEFTRNPLTVIHFNKINPIIPLIDKSAFLQAQHEGTVSVFLERAICLAAAKDPAAREYLCLADDQTPVSSRQFCSELYRGLTVAMDALLEPDRITRIQTLALMSLHCEGHEGGEAASSNLCQAIHQAQTIGLHLDRPDRIFSDPPVQLFWSLWTLDKMHASIGGRPVILADRDIGAVKPSNTRAAGAFGVWLAISDLLATVISYYRPSAGITSGWEEGFPAFEDIVGEDGHGELDIATLGLLELYYHSIAILSCRYKASESLDSTRISSIRQGLAAVRIHSIVAEEGGKDLPPLPIVPYAVSLSMGVSYRQLRSSRLITHFNRAKSSLEACCTLLENLSPHWYSAEAMARLGRKALQQSQRDQAASHPQTSRDAGIPTAPEARASGPVHEASNWDTNPAVPDNAAVPEVQDLDSALEHDTSMGFADIDTLFGEFLDLSLPTNFWDPIFAEQEPSGH